jgi:hypothetical protein
MQVTLLCSCNSNGSIRLFINEYESYDKMIEDDRKLDLNFDEDDLFYINFNFSEISIKTIKYYIGGTDYCINEGKIKSYKEHNQNHCESLHNRESFIIYNIDDEKSFAIIFREKEVNRDNIGWKKEFMNNEYSYETNFVNFSNDWYNLKNSDSKNIISVRFKNVSQESIDYILKTIKDEF